MFLKLLFTLQTVLFSLVSFSFSNDLIQIDSNENSTRTMLCNLFFIFILNCEKDLGSGHQT